MPGINVAGCLKFLIVAPNVGSIEHGIGSEQIYKVVDSSFINGRCVLDKGRGSYR